MIQKTVIKRKLIRERVPARIGSAPSESDIAAQQNVPSPKQAQMESEAPRQNNG